MLVAVIEIAWALGRRVRIRPERFGEAFTKYSLDGIPAAFWIS